MTTPKIWNSELYDKSQDFVSAYGKNLLELLPASGVPLRILDLGCGTGDLTHELAQLGHHVLGVDASESMIDSARQKYPDLQFLVQDASALSFESEFDFVFSNATFHWIRQQHALHAGIVKALKPSGYLLAEFGAQGNIAKICQAFDEVLQEWKSSYDCPFYFPTDEDYAAVVRAAGLEIELLYSYDRPTLLPHGERGLRYWMQQFFSAELAHYKTMEQERIFQSCEEKLKAALFDGQAWVADYRRLQVFAKKI